MEPATARDVYPVLLGMEWVGDLPGGLNRYLADLVRALGADGGPEPQAVVLGPASEAPPGVFAASSRHVPVPRRLVEYALKADQLAAAADVLDSHFALYGAAALAHRRVRKRPLVVHFQGPWAAESAAIGERGLRIRRLIETLVYRRAVQLVVLSSASRRVLVEQYGVSPWRVVVLPPGVDLERFKPGSRAEARAVLGLPAGAFIVATARRLVPRTGVDVLLDSWIALQHDGHADQHDVLVIAGEGPEAAPLRTRAERAGLGRRVRFLGRVTDETLVSLYRAADLVVIPSVALEGFGLVALEALACGTAVLASDQGGLVDAVGGLGPRTLVPAGDPISLAHRLREVRDRPELLPSPEACRAHAERFSWSEVARAHRRLYREAVFGRVRRRRIVFVTHTAVPSGAELALLRLVAALNGAVEAHVLVGEEGPLVDLLARAGISHEVLGFGDKLLAQRRSDLGRAGSRQALAAAAATRTVARLLKRIRRLRPDLVHTNSLKAGFTAGLASRAVGVPVVWHIHDRIASDYLPPRAVRLVRWFADVVPSRVVVNSEATATTLTGLRKPIAVVPNVVPIDDLDGVRAREASGSRPFSVGVVGRFAPWKGQDVAVRAFASAFPDGQELLRLIGAPLFGEDQYMQDVRQLAKRLGIDSRVELAGHREDVAAELASLDVMVHSSVLPEPFGQSIVEAQAFGVPVVAAAAGGVLELVEDGASGLLYPAGDVEALASRLRRLASDPELRDRLAQGGREAALRCAPEAVVPRMLEVYEAVLAGQ